MTEPIRRREVLRTGAAAVTVAAAGCSGTSEDATETSVGDAATASGTDAAATGANERTESPTMPSTILNGDVAQRGDLSLSSPHFTDGERLPDWAGYGEANENPELSIDGVPDAAESLVVVVDDPDARPVAGHTWNHWCVWDIDPSIGTIPRDWDVGDATEGFNDFTEFGYGGPAPPEGTHGYRFKLVAVDSTVGVPRETRKTRVGSTIELTAEVLGATQLVGTYSAEQGDGS